MKPQHQAIAAGLALTLAFGTAATPSTLFANTDTDSEDSLVAAEGASADGTDTGTDETAEELPAPADFDRTDEYEEDPTVEAKSQGMPSIMMLSVNSLIASRAMSIQPTSLSSEMKYFAENESGSNYDQGFSYYDGYNAMGFYQFDRRYSLVEFMEACYAYDPDTYAMFEPVIERGDELKSGTIYDSSTKRLTEIGQLAQDAWHAAYAANPSEFSALQDDFAYQEYYLPVERILRNTFGVDISGRADCVKGLAWGMCNLFGSGGCQKYFELAKLSDDMSDRELVNALCDAVVENVGGQWAASYRARYERERATCLEYIAEDEAQNDADNNAGSGSSDSDANGNGGSIADDDANGNVGSDSDSDADADGGSDSDSDADADGGSDADSDADGNVGSDSDSDADADGGSNADSDSDGDSNGGSDADSDADGNSGSNADSDANGNGGTDADSNGGTNSDADSDAGSNGGSNSNSNAGSGSNSGSASNGILGSGNGANAGSGTDSDSNNGASSGGTTNSAGGSSNSDTGSTNGDSTKNSQSAGADGNASTSGQEKSESDDSTAGDTSASDGKKDEDAKRTATTDEREKLPATADAASIGLAVSAGLSAIGAAAAVVGKKGRGTHVPFEDGFRE